MLGIDRLPILLLTSLLESVNFLILSVLFCFWFSFLSFFFFPFLVLVEGGVAVVDGVNCAFGLIWT